jgi:anthranilate/para-aminobenzoate synthase component II
MLNNTKVYIIDFEDSFTFNIANVLYPFVKAIEVVNYKIFFEFYFKKILSQKKIAVILGPGPGAPEEYALYFFKIAQLLKHHDIYLMGICLGHQLIATQLEYTITNSSRPIHGERVSVEWRKHRFFVQRYNSLAVLKRNLSGESSIGNEVMILEYKNGQSCQFHPESIGSDDSIHFFKDLLCFIRLGPR